MILNLLWDSGSKMLYIEVHKGTFPNKPCASLILAPSGICWSIFAGELNLLLLGKAVHMLSHDIKVIVFEHLICIHFV